MKSRLDLINIKRCVVKIGSAVLTDNGRALNRQAIDRWATQIAELKQQGIDVVIVSSGSVAEGMSRLGWRERPHALQKQQAAASVGQMGLIQAYEESFQKLGSITAQVLLTHDDLTNRKRYLNAQATIKTLLDLGVVPIINENDVVANDELRVGDNDTLAAIIANLISADLLIILTDQLGFYNEDPRVHAHAKLITEANADDKALDLAASGGSGMLGRGGMQTKLAAARIAARSGASTVIAPGLKEQIILSIINGVDVGTMLLPTIAPVSARKRWLTVHLEAKGQLILDQGACEALKHLGVSILPVGVVGVKGTFNRGDLVLCINADGIEVARGLVNYDAQDIDKIKQRKSAEIEGLLGFVAEAELIHRDNLVLSN